MWNNVPYYFFFAFFNLKKRSNDVVVARYSTNFLKGMKITVIILLYDQSTINIKIVVMGTEHYKIKHTKPI